MSSWKTPGIADGASEEIDRTVLSRDDFGCWSCGKRMALPETAHDLKCPRCGSFHSEQRMADQIRRRRGGLL